MRITTVSTCSSSSSVTTSDSLDSEFSSLLPSPDDTLPPTGKDRRVLRFYPRVLMQETLHIKNYSPVEIAESWYSDEEFSQIRMDMQKILCDTKVSLKDSEYNIAMWRGLEGLTQYGSKRRNDQKIAGWLVVIRNSHHHHFDQNVNEVATFLNRQRLAHEYHVATQSAVLDAIQRAQGDDSIAHTYRKWYASEWNNNCTAHRRYLLRKIPRLPIRRIKRMFSRRMHSSY
jgi:hypothetical protein